MYTAYKRQTKHKTFLKFVLFAAPIVLIIALAIWLLLFRNQDPELASFSKAGEEVAVVKPEVTTFEDSGLYKITLPSGWAANGRKNPFSNQVYYEYQNKVKNYDNRFLRVYVDVYPEKFAVNRVLPIGVNQNRITNDGPGSVSDECRTFTGAPISGAPTSGQTWSAKWKNVTFTCDMNKAQNYIGTASIEEGYGVTLVNTNGSKHKYFFLYIDHNVRPDYKIFTDALDSFTAT